MIREMRRDYMMRRLHGEGDENRLHDEETGEKTAS